jgi:hypothetical protein
VYAHKKFLYTSMMEAETNGELYTIFGSIPYLKGDLIATNWYGDQKIIPKGQDDEHIPVEMKLNTPSKKPSPFEEQYAKQLIETPILNQNEDEDYIKNTRNMVSKL